jgi:hypothetical protein
MHQPVRRQMPSTSLRCFAVSLFLTVTVFLQAAPVQSGQSLPPYEESLRARVQQYYGFLQLGKFAEASTLVTRGTRENFQNTHKGPFLSFTLDAIHFDPAGSTAPRKAAVTVQLEVFPFGAVSTLHAPETTNWTRVGEIWYLEAPPPHVATFEELTKGGKQAKTAPPDEIKFTTFKSDMGKLKIGEKGVSIFPFKNTSDHPTTLEVTTYCDCLLVKGLKKQYQAGETGELRVDFDSTNYLDDYAQTIFVKTLPGGASTRLLITGFVLRPNQEKPETPQKPDPAAPETPGKPVPQLP